MVLFYILPVFDNNIDFFTREIALGVGPKIIVSSCKCCDKYRLILNASLAAFCSFFAAIEINTVKSMVDNFLHDGHSFHIRKIVHNFAFGLTELHSVLDYKFELKLLLLY